MVGDSYKQCRLATEKDISDFNMEKHRNSLRSTISKFFKYYDKINSLSVDEMEKIVEIIKDKIWYTNIGLPVTIIAIYAAIFVALLDIVIIYNET